MSPAGPRALDAPRHGHLVGHPCPRFAVVDTFGDRLTHEDLRGGPSLVVFFPFAFTPVCDEELSELERRIREFDDVGILAISCDPVASLRRFQADSDFSFDMASDFWPHGSASDAFGVFDPGSGHPMRGSFVMDPAGVITWSVLNPAGQGRRVDEYVQALAPLRA